ncbi:8-oxoguanine DNA glycosylase OGG fold protein [Brevibacterium moorei]|uniref:8-oxoguanine DNA glycosylase OGG fold protein n=1 Tax=Brevibacterium moorei TaxID=2968457 RepID=UPI00211C8827|nr:hypothetical protein [Brevibacterium sp. 68QC2CO]MCQ9386418.1 hypothetical protein [Brevibacterium sp. 68QC2CO]
MNLPTLPEALRLQLEAVPTQGKFEWKRKPWLEAVHDVPDAHRVVSELPDLVDRQIIRDVVQTNLSHDHVLGGFVAMRIWGSGADNRGPSRARSCLTGIVSRDNKSAPVDETVRDKLLKAAEIVQTGDAEAGFYYMKNDGWIRNLGGAFFTKWLSFSSMTGAIDGPEVAPILDARVCGWIAENTAGEQQIRLTTDRTKAYRKYLELLDAWGSQSDPVRTRAQVELAIFNLT